MHWFLKQHQDWILVSVAAFLLGAMIGFYIWGIEVVLGNLTHAVSSGSTVASPVQFHVDDAAKILSDRGLLQ